MRVQWLAFDGTFLGDLSGVVFGQEASEGEGEVAVESASRSRTGAAPVHEGITRVPRTFGFSVVRESGVAWSEPDFRREMPRLFAPERGPRTLLGVTEDGVEVELTVNVLRFGPRPRWRGSRFDGQFEAVDRFWTAVQPVADSSSPLTNRGTWTALPALTLTPTSPNVRHHVRTVTNPNNRPLRNFIYRLAPTFTNAGQSTANHYEVFINGLPVPFQLYSPGTSPAIWARLDLPPLGTAVVHIVYGSGVANSGTAQTLDPGSLDLSASTNTNWVFAAAGWLLSAHPEVPGSWFYGRLGIHPEGVTDGFVSELTTEATVGIRSSGILGGEGNAFILHLGGVEAGSGSALSGHQLTLTNLNGAAVVAVYTRKHGQSVYTRTVVAVPNATTSFTVTDATEIAIVLEAGSPDGGGVHGANLKVAPQSGGTPQIALKSATVPTQAQTSDVAARVLTGALTLTGPGHAVTCDRVYVDDGDVIIDCAARRITWPNSSVLWAGDGLSFSEPAEWLPLAEGDNAYTNTLAATPLFQWKERYA